MAGAASRAGDLPSAGKEGTGVTCCVLVLCQHFPEGAGKGQFCALSGLQTDGESWASQQNHWRLLERRHTS